MSEEFLTIREMCETFDVTPRSLRFYEQKELLFPLREGRKRLYSRRDRARLKLILRGKRFGVSLEEIRQILDMHHTDAGKEVQLSRAIETANRRLNEMKAQRAGLDQDIAELSVLIAKGHDLMTTWANSAA